MSTRPATDADERAIRQLVDAWMSATKAGDIDTVLSLMTDDVVFLTPGRPPMHKTEFESAAREMAKPGGPRFDGRNDIREIVVAGDIAYLWGELSVTATPPRGAAPVTRHGPVLSVLRREQGRWRVARDANMLGAPSPTTA